MARSAVLVPLAVKSGSEGHGSTKRVHSNVEISDDYSSDDDGYSSPLEEALFEHLPSLVPVTLTSKRTAESRAADNDLLCEGSKRQRLMTSTLPKALLLPKSIWIDIFSQLPPNKLAQLRRTCKLFSDILSEQAIWRASRNTWLPDMPKPVFNLNEWEMLSLAKGEGCMICGSEIHIRAVYWAFRTRCCTQCFNQNMTKESSLPSTYPRELLTALPYGFIDTTGQWVFYAHSQRQLTGLTKVYWNDDLKSIKIRYEDAKSMNAEEEWLKGLESEGIENRADIIRMEAYETRLLSRGKSQVIMSASDTTLNSRYGIPVPHLQRGSHMKLNWNNQQQNHPVIHVQPQPSPHPLLNSHVAQSSMPYLYPAPPLQKSMAFAAQNAGTNWQAAFIPGTQLPTTRKARGSISKPERSASEVAEVRRARQLEIEERCLKLNPPIYPSELHSMPAFKTTMLIAVQLTEKAWQHLLPKLLEQRKEASVPELSFDSRKPSEPTPTEVKKPHDCHSRELKEKKELEWDEYQKSVKEKLDKYATSIIDGWILQHCQGQRSKMNKDLALKFAPEVLVLIRERYYAENPYTAEDPGHHTLLDPNSPEGAAALDQPTNSRLLLENMKYVFDNKIKPLTDAHRKELFICSGCENNPKLYGFEGIIQHYAAKHTALMSLGSVIVHWKTDWPYIPPFLMNSTPPAMARSLRYNNLQAQSTSQFANNLISSGSIRGTGRPNIHADASHLAISMNQQSADAKSSTNKKNSKNPTAQSSSIHSVTLEFQSSQVGGVLDSFNGHKPAGLHKSETCIPVKMNFSQDNQLEILATIARESWSQLSGIKDLHSSIRVHYVIQRIVQAFRVSSISQGLQLNIFIEALKEHNLMKPMRNANGLQCLACVPNPSTSSHVPSGTVGRVFTLLALAQHFETVHVLRNRSRSKPDWKTQMIKLPDNQSISLLRDAIGMDDEKFRLLTEVFPLAFKPLLTPRGDIPSRVSIASMTNLNQPITSPPSTAAASNRDVSVSRSSPQDSQCQDRPVCFTPPFSEHSPKSNVNELRRCPSPPSYQADYLTGREYAPIPLSQKYDESSMTAAERFLATFLQEDTSQPTAASRECADDVTWGPSSSKKVIVQRRDSEDSCESSPGSGLISFRRRSSGLRELDAHVPDSYFTYRTPPCDDDRYSPCGSQSARYHKPSPPLYSVGYKMSTPLAYSPISPSELDSEYSRKNSFDGDGTRKRTHAYIQLPTPSANDSHHEHYVSKPNFEEIYYEREPIPLIPNDVYGYPVLYHPQHGRYAAPPNLRIPSPIALDRHSNKQLETRYHNNHSPELGRRKRKRSTSPPRSRSPRKQESYPSPVNEYYKTSELPHTGRGISTEVLIPHPEKYAIVARKPTRHSNTIIQRAAPQSPEDNGLYGPLPRRLSERSMGGEDDELMDNVEYDGYKDGRRTAQYLPLPAPLPYSQRLEVDAPYGANEDEERYRDSRRYKEWNVERRIYLPAYYSPPPLTQPSQYPQPLAKVYVPADELEKAREAAKRITRA